MLPRLKSLSSIDAGQGMSAVWDAAASVWKPQGWLEYDESVGISSTSSTSFQEKLTLTTSASMPAGTYLVCWHIVWATATSYSINTRLRIGTTTLVEYQSRGSNSAAFNQPSNFGAKLVAFSAGSETLDWYFRRNGGVGGSVDCSNANIMMQWVHA